MKRIIGMTLSTLTLLVSFIHAGEMIKDRQADSPAMDGLSRSILKSFSTDESIEITELKLIEDTSGILTLQGKTRFTQSRGSLKGHFSLQMQTGGKSCYNEIRSNVIQTYRGLMGYKKRLFSISLPSELSKDEIASLVLEFHREKHCFHFN